MNRRATLARLLGKTEQKVSVQTKPSAVHSVLLFPDGNSTLTPYTGTWGYEQAAHLLRRTTFGPTYEKIKEAAAGSLDSTISQLFQELPLPYPPVNYSEANDPYVPIGETWVNAPYSPDINLRAHRNRSLRAWTLDLLFTEGISIREKLTLFWHNHFAINNTNDPKFLYKYITTIRSHAWGNFRDLVKAITIDPSMLRFLNGNQNTNLAPNENYARELMELFTLGKGELAGPGDYTTFTEEDVMQMARVLTGWRDLGFNTNNPSVSVTSYFQANRHDTGSKQLSHRFNNVIINNMGDKEYLHLIDIIFQKTEVARFICRKLYRWFVYYEIDTATETNVIEPMAQILIDNDYNIKPALEALLRSEHFFDILNVGPMIKNPIDFLISAVKQTETPIPTDLRQRYNTWYQLFRLTPAMQMEYYFPPDVAGWKAYYQEPSFYRIWINASTLPNRMLFTDTLAGNGYGFSNPRFKINPLRFVAILDDPYDPNSVVREFAKILLPQALSEAQLTALKEVLIPGLPDYEWSVEYGEYTNDPSNVQLANALDAKLRNLLKAMLSMPEFYLS